jgi:hypothetical protein
MEWIIALVAIAGIAAFGLSRKKARRGGGGSLSKGSDTQLK